MYACSVLQKLACLFLFVVVSQTNDAAASVAFAGSAFLLPYYFGVMEKLIELKVVDPNKTKFGGISGGAVTTVLTCAGLSPRDLQSRFEQVFSICHEVPEMCSGELNRFVKKMVYDKVLDDEKLKNCFDDRIRIGITQLDTSANSFEQATAFVESNFTGAADVEEAILASSYISCFSGDTTYTLFRGVPSLDGGYKADYDQICHPGEPCLKVSAYFVGTNVTEGQADPNWSVIAKASTPGPLKTWPRFDLDEWNLPTDCSYDFDKFQMPTNPDIYPGHFNKIKYSADQWRKLSMTLGDLEDRLYMIELGKLDAQAWFEQVHSVSSKKSNLRSH